MYSSNEFIEEFHVNKIIEELLQNEFQSNDLFPKNYLVKRFDYKENDDFEKTIEMEKSSFF